MKILTNLDFNQNQIMNAVVQKLATAPANPISGQIYFNTTQSKAYFYNGFEWIAMGATDPSDVEIPAQSIVEAINGSTFLIDDDNLSEGVRNAIAKAHDTHTIVDVAGLQDALDSKETPSGAQSKVDAHEGNKNNPHGVTKAQVGLGNVLNYGIATQTESESGISDVKYMTPLRTRQAISKQIADEEFATNESLTNGLAEKVDNSRVLTDVPANAKFTDTTYEKFSTSADGLAPKSDGNTGKYLRADGTWVTPPDTKYTLPVAGTGLGGIKTGGSIDIDSAGIVTVKDNSHGHTIANIAGLQTALNEKETPAGATSKASVAENNAKAYTDTKLSELIGGAPEALDTLHELAAALGEDPNFAASILDRLAEQTKKHVEAIGNGSETNFVLTHNLDTRDINVTIRETASPYAQVYTDVEMTTTDTVTIKFAKAPANNQYTVTIIG